VKHYQDKLPDRSPRIKKVNAAITSDLERFVKSVMNGTTSSTNNSTTNYNNLSNLTVPMYWFKAEDISKHGMPQHIRGCNQMGAIHHSLEFWLDRLKLWHKLQISQVPVKTFETLAVEERVGSISRLKVDVEGQDLRVISSAIQYFNHTAPSAWPCEFHFESKYLKDEAWIRMWKNEWWRMGPGYALLLGRPDSKLVRLSNRESCYWKGARMAFPSPEETQWISSDTKDRAKNTFRHYFNADKVQVSETTEKK